MGLLEDGPRGKPAQSDAEKDEKGVRNQEEKTLEMLNDLRLAVATARQRQESLETQRQPMAAREAELVELISAGRTDIANYEGKLAAQAQENRDSQTAIKEQTTRAAEAERRRARGPVERSEAGWVANPCTRSVSRWVRYKFIRGLIWRRRKRCKTSEYP